MGGAERYKFLPTPVVERPKFFAHLCILKARTLVIQEDPIFFTVKTEGPLIGGAESYKFFWNINLA